jgi:hypothetical protein
MKDQFSLTRCYGWRNGRKLEAPYQSILRPEAWGSIPQSRVLDSLQTGFLAAFNYLQTHGMALSLRESYELALWSDRISLLSTAEFSLEQDTF